MSAQPSGSSVETVILDPPRRITFRLLRGPVPHVLEIFSFDETDSGTRIRYDGELGTDLGPLGEYWGRVVARTWVATVAGTLEQIRTKPARRARSD